MNHGHEYGSQWDEIRSAAQKLGPKAETVRLWFARPKKVSGRRPGAATDEQSELNA